MCRHLRQSNHPRRYNNSQVEPRVRTGSITYQRGAEYNVDTIPQQPLAFSIPMVPQTRQPVNTESDAIGGTVNERS